MRIGLFADHDVNTGRQPFLDGAKAFAIFWMVMVHVFEEFDIFESSTFFAPDAPMFGRLLGCVLAGVFAAPVFMFALGVGVAYSRNSAEVPMRRRGLGLLLKWLLLNLVRYPLPMWILLWFVPTLATDDSDPRSLLAFLFENEILGFAGLAFLLLALLKRLHVSAGGALALAALMSAFGSVVCRLDLGNMAANLAVSSFIDVESEGVCSRFPLLNWFVFPAAGLLFGKMLRRCVSTARLFTVLTPLALVVFVPLTVWYWRTDSGIMASGDMSFYRMGLSDALYVLTGVLVILGLWVFAAQFVRGGLKTAMAEVSKAINEVYIVQWMLVCWTQILVQKIMGFRPGVAGAVCLAVTIWLAACLIGCCWRRKMIQLQSILPDFVILKTKTK